MLDQLKVSAINFFQKHSSVIILNAIKIFGLTFIICLTYGVYKFLTAFLPISISILILLALLHKLVRLICRVGTFPGSTWYWRRNIENYFQKAYVNKMKKRMTTLRALVEYILQERHWNGFCNVDELTHIRKTIASTLLIFQKQVTHDTINKKQREVMNQFTDIEQTLNDLKISTKPDNRTFTMWSFLEQRERFIETPKTILYFGDKNQGNFLLHKCMELEERLGEIVSKKKWYKGLKRWAFEETFGTLDQLREELDMRYKCRPMSLRTDKDVLLDGMLVYGKHSKEERQSMFERAGNTRGKPPQEIKRDQPSDKTIIFCCPNAGYYEYMFCENEWVELYLRNGFNVLLWNYRGFGRSTGHPTPNGFRRDGEAIVDFLRKDMGMKKIGVHGESLGGIVTTHIARAKNIDYMCADRTFASLSSVAEISFGDILAKIFRLFTLWDDQISRDYLSANCYKIITCDPKDEIIHMMASLKYGVTSRLIQQKLGYKDVIPIPDLMEDRSSWVFRIGNLFQKFVLAVKREFQFKKIKQGIAEYNELLNKDQTLALYCAFNRICELFDTLASLNALNTRKKNSGGRPKPQMSKPAQPGSSGQDDDARQRSVPKGQVTSADEGISFVNETRGLNESLDPKGSNHSDDSDIMESIHKKSYHEEFNAVAQSQEKVVDLLVKIYGVFEDLEAGGVFMSDVMSVKEKLRFTAFQHFIHSFKIWGSYYPLLGVVEKGVIDQSFYQANAADKLKHFITKIDKILQKQRQDITRKNSKLIQLVLDDLEVISSLMPTLYQRLTVKNTYTSSATNSSRFNSSKQQEIELEIGPNKDTQHLRTSGGYTDLESSTYEDYNNIGHLIPLTCGHNGTPRPLEIQLFEYLLLRSGLVE